MRRRLRLRGPDAALAACLDRLHVACEVAGVIERERELEVWVDGPVPPIAAPDVSIEELDDDVRAWTGLEHDAAIEVAPDLLVRPPWVERPAGFTGVELVVPRGMAFGSGEHGSTQAALCALHACWPATPPRTFADVGTGSGILALYAHRRGAVRVLACDVEPESVAAARALVPTAEVRLGGAESLGLGTADLVVANLDARQLDAALDAIQRVWSERSPLVLSGLRPHESAPLVARLRARPVRTIERAGFVAVTFVAR